MIILVRTSLSNFQFSVFQNFKVILDCTKNNNMVGQTSLLLHSLIILKFLLKRKCRNKLNLGVV